MVGEGEIKCQGELDHQKKGINTTNIGEKILAAAIMLLQAVGVADAVASCVAALAINQKETTLK